MVKIHFLKDGIEIYFNAFAFFCKKFAFPERFCCIVKLERTESFLGESNCFVKMKYFFQTVQCFSVKRKLFCEKTQMICERMQCLSVERNTFARKCSVSCGMEIVLRENAMFLSGTQTFLKSAMFLGGTLLCCERTKYLCERTQQLLSKMTHNALIQSVLILLFNIEVW